MPLTERFLEKLIFMEFRNTTRFTQDSPVYPDVWMDYFKHSYELDVYRLDLILTPHNDSSAAELFMLLNQKKPKTAPRKKGWQLASSGETVVASLTFFEMIRFALPLTKWWHRYLWKQGKPTPDQDWLMELCGAILYESGKRDRKIVKEDNVLYHEYRKLFRSEFNKHFKVNLTGRHEKIALWSISRNRMVSISIEKSISCTKADAGRRVFDIDGSGIAWAILDTGIDAGHRAFRKQDAKTGKPFQTPFGAIKDPESNRTRIVASYDFTRFRDIIVGIHSNSGKERHQSIKCTGNDDDQPLTQVEVNNYISEIGNDLRKGRMLDWTILAPLLRIPHNRSQYTPPEHPHGTHVAGILGANAIDKIKGDLIGMCPSIQLYDFRIMDSSGTGQEFNILAAMQFVRWLNSQKEGLIIHGANMSFSTIHEVASYACGQTPVCLAAERLISDGMVVVAAAGNQGQAIFQSPTGLNERGFRIVNITDPGNAEQVITVGSTHRSRPHSYGVSYFSSKGPTGDGRLKPDLVAPGEKIVSTGLNDTTERMDGTSMAAPHVSGAAALLLSRNTELIGRPRKVKEILCKTATDLGREKYFQGCGMVDVLRAIQSV